MPGRNAATVVFVKDCATWEFGESTLELMGCGEGSDCAALAHCQQESRLRMRLIAVVEYHDAIVCGQFNRQRSVAPEFTKDMNDEVTRRSAVPDSRDALAIRCGRPNCQQGSNHDHSERSHGAHHSCRTQPLNRGNASTSVLSAAEPSHHASHRQPGQNGQEDLDPALGIPPGHGASVAIDDHLVGLRTVQITQ